MNQPLVLSLHALRFLCCKSLLSSWTISARSSKAGPYAYSKILKSKKTYKPSATSGFWWEMPCLRSMCLRVCVVVDVTKPLLQLISVSYVRCKELPFCSFSCSLLGHTSMVWHTPMEQDQVGNGKLPWNDDRAWPLVFFLEKGNFIYFKHNTSRWYIVLKFSRPLSERHTA